MVKLDIFSDPICPWCYIGKTLLDQALAQREEQPFMIEWHPFQLNPHMPEEGMDRRAYLEGKFGGKSEAVQAYLPIQERAQELGLAMNLSDIKRTPNTLDAHRVLHWAALEEKQTAMVDALFGAYFVDSRDIGDHDVLADLADENGLDARVILRLLASDQDKEAIMARDKSAREMGVNSVPTFIAAGTHAVPGAQPAELWLNVIDEITGA